MATNFKQWNPDVNNQQNDSAYNSDTMRANGATAGVFNSTLANKLFFQLASMTAALGTALSNKGYTVNDGSANVPGNDFAALVAVLQELGTFTELGQSRAYPETLTADGKMTFTAGTGTITVDAGQEILFRDYYKYDADNIDAGDRTFATIANTVYHLRFVHRIDSAAENMTANFYTAHSITAGSFYIVDITDTDYNPSSLSAIDSYFDSKRDDALLASVSASAGNVVTSLPLVNLQRLRYETSVSNTFANSPDWDDLTGSDFAYNWARTPVRCRAYISLAKSWAGAPSTDSWVDGVGNGLLAKIGVRVKSGFTRYGGSLEYCYDDGRYVKDATPITDVIPAQGNDGYGTAVVDAEA